MRIINVNNYMVEKSKRNKEVTPIRDNYHQSINQNIPASVSFGRQVQKVARKLRKTGRQVQKAGRKLQKTGRKARDFMQNFAGMIEIAINTKCNLKCPYCPNSLQKGPIPEKIMPINVFRKILKDLKAIGYKGKICFHRYNEPMLINVERYIKEVKKILPNATAELFTNGTKLTPERLKKLIESGVDKVIVTQHTRKGFLNELLKFDDEFLKAVSARHGDELILSNRGGVLNLEKGSKSDVSKQPCSRPKKTTVIDTNGDVLICCDDYSKKTIVGNVNKNSIKEIWNSPEYRKIRKLLSQGKRKEVKACKKCTGLDSNSTSARDNRISLNNATYRRDLLEKTGSARLEIVKA